MEISVNFTPTTLVMCRKQMGSVYNLKSCTDQTVAYDPKRLKNRLEKERLQKYKIAYITCKFLR